MRTPYSALSRLAARANPNGLRSRWLGDSFNRRFYDEGEAGGTWASTTWLGVPILKCPMDLWIYQELIFQVGPDLIIETGTAWGGSALYLASLCDIVGRGEVLTIDVVNAPGRPEHARLSYHTGSSVAGPAVDLARARAAGGAKVMVILDSDHRAAHVAEELRLYAPLVTIGSYLIVEDTNINGHPVKPSFGPGPMEAVAEFLRLNRGFEVDRSRERLLVTFNPMGYLRRVETPTHFPPQPVRT
ncbi:MAG: CmcI family methyltransferase [Acidimicrobiales bacterium]